MPQKRLRLVIDIDAGVVLRDKHAGTNAWNGNEWWRNGPLGWPWRGDDGPDVSLSACLDASHSQAADVAISVSPFMLPTGRSHLIAAVNMGLF